MIGNYSVPNWMCTQNIIRVFKFLIVYSFCLLVNKFQFFQRFLCVANGRTRWVFVLRYICMFNGQLAEHRSRCLLHSKRRDVETESEHKMPNIRTIPCAVLCCVVCMLFFFYLTSFRVNMQRNHLPCTIITGFSIGISSCLHVHRS